MNQTIAENIRTNRLILIRQLIEEALVDGRDMSTFGYLAVAYKSIVLAIQKAAA